MSVKLMSLVFDLDPEQYKATRKIILLALADHANEDGRSIYPSVARLCHKCGLGETTVHEVLADLKGRQLIVSHGQVGPSGTVEYHINIEVLKAGGAPYVLGGYATRTGGVRQPVSGGAPAAPKSSYNHQLTTSLGDTGVSPEPEVPPVESYLPASEDDDITLVDAGDEWGDAKPGRPSWTLPNANDTQLLAALHATGRQFYHTRLEKSNWKKIIQGQISGKVTTEWVQDCIKYAAEQQSMKFDSLLKWILNPEKMADWLQRKAGLERKDKAKKEGELILDGEELARQNEAYLLRKQRGE